MNTQTPEPSRSPTPGPDDDLLITIDKVGRLNPEPNTRDKPQRTTRSLWFLTYAAIMGLVVARLPPVLRETAAKIPEDVKAELGDERLAEFSVTVGGVMFVIVYAVVIALYLWLAATLDRRIIPTKATLRGRWNVGLFFVIAVVSTIPVHLVSVIAQVPDARVILGYYAYFPVAAVAALFLFRIHWSIFSTGRKLAVIALAAALSLLPVLG